MQAKNGPAQSKEEQKSPQKLALTVEDKQLKDPNVPDSIKKAMIAKRNGDAQDAKDQTVQAKKDHKNEEAVINSEKFIAKKPASVPSNKPSKPEKEPSKPSIASLAQIATGSRAAFFAIQISQVLASKHSLEMQIGSLSMLKLSDIVKKNELMRQIFLLQQQIEVLKAQQEQAATSELIQQQAARYKSTDSTPKPKGI